MKKPKLMIIGHARHGKDTVCDILSKQYGYSYTPSSRLALDIFIYDKIKNRYSSKEECFNDRHNNRKEWFDLIAEYNKKDSSRLIKKIYTKTDIYCGLRSKLEFNAGKAKKLFRYTLWVDRSKYLPNEGADSITVEKSDADFIIDNNGSLEELEAKIKTLMSILPEVVYGK